MKRTLSLAVATIAFCLITPAGHAQNHLRLRFHVPFSFNINNQSFAPGEYEFTQQSYLLLEVCNLKDHASAFETVQPAQSRKEGNGHVRLLFHRYDNQYFLIAVSDGSWESTYDFEISPEEKVLAQATPRKPVMTVSGSMIVAITVRTLMTLFRRFEVTATWSSSRVAPSSRNESSRSLTRAGTGTLAFR